MKLLWIYLIGINLFTFFVYGADKMRARKEQRRVSESTLLGLALLGGAAGAWFGMYVFHHKTRKAKFKYGVPFTLIAELLVLAALSLSV